MLWYASLESSVCLMTRLLLPNHYIVYTYNNLSCNQDNNYYFQKIRFVVLKNLQKVFCTFLDQCYLCWSISWRETKIKISLSYLQLQIWLTFHTQFASYSRHHSIVHSSMQYQIYPTNPTSQSPLWSSCYFEQLTWRASSDWLRSSQFGWSLDWSHRIPAKLDQLFCEV